MRRVRRTSQPAGRQIKERQFRCGTCSYGINCDELVRKTDPRALRRTAGFVLCFSTLALAALYIASLYLETDTLLKASMPAIIALYVGIAIACVQAILPHYFVFGAVPMTIQVFENCVVFQRSAPGGSFTALRDKELSMQYRADKKKLTVSGQVIPWDVTQETIVTSGDIRSGKVSIYMTPSDIARIQKNTLGIIRIAD